MRGKPPAAVSVAFTWGGLTRPRISCDNLPAFTVLVDGAKPDAPGEYTVVLGYFWGGWLRGTVGEGAVQFRVHVQ